MSSNDEVRAPIPLPLRGVTVLDFSWLLPGPYCSLLLAELGSRIVKIEGPRGDYAREMLPGMFKVANHSKLGLSLDLKAPGALEVIDRLLGQADVVIEGFRPGVADRLGIGYRRLAARKPALVYASVSGYGAEGPEALRPGHDLNYSAAAGVLSIPGRWGDPPARSGLPLADLSASLYGALAIVAALRERDRSGRGGFLDVGMMATALNMAQVRFADHAPGTARPWHHVSPLNDIFQTADGRGLTLALVERKFWLVFCKQVGLDDPALLADFDRFEHDGDAAVGERLRAAVAAAIGRRGAADWQAFLAAADIAFALALSPAEALAQPQATANGYVQTGPDGLPVVRFSGRRLRAPGHDPGAAARRPRRAGAAWAWLQPSGDRHPAPGRRSALISACAAAQAGFPGAPFLPARRIDHNCGARSACRATGQGTALLPVVMRRVFTTARARSGSAAVRLAIARAQSSTSRSGTDFQARPSCTARGPSTSSPNTAIAAAVADEVICASSIM